MTIDYICVSDVTKVSSHQQSLPGVSQYDALFAELVFEVERNPPRYVTYRSFRNFNRYEFNRDLSNIYWRCIVDIPNVDDKVGFFTSAITNLYDRHAPYHSYLVKKKASPWFTSDLQDLVKARNKAWRQYKRFGRGWDHLFYKELRKRVKSATRNTISSYYRNKLHNATNSKKMWNIVSDIGLGTSSKDNFALPADVDTVNRHFAGTSNPVPLNDLRPTARISPDNRFYFRHVSGSDVAEAVLAAKSNAKGPDDIPVSFLKECLSSILPALMNIFDCSLQAGVFPSAWKQAIVRPIPKRHPPLELEHLRPINILSAPSKILETIANKQLSEFVTRNDLLDPRQSGFRKGHSTHTALVSIVDDIWEAIDV